MSATHVHVEETAGGERWRGIPRRRANRSSHDPWRRMYVVLAAGTEVPFVLGLDPGLQSGHPGGSGGPAATARVTRLQTGI